MLHRIVRTIVTLMFVALSFAALPPALAQTQLEQARADVARRRGAVSAIDRASDPIAWGNANVEFGKSLYRLWDFDSVQESAEAYQRALEVLTRENSPAGWLEAQDGLGQALLSIAERRQARLLLSIIGAPNAAPADDPLSDAIEAAAAFRQVLSVRTRQNDRLAWARTQANLGNTLSVVVLSGRLRGAPESATEDAREEAQAAYLNALHAFSHREALDRGSVYERLSALYEMEAQATDQYAPDDATYDRLATQRVRALRRAVESARAAERAFHQAGDSDRVEHMRLLIERLNDRLMPCPRGMVC